MLPVRVLQGVTEEGKESLSISCLEEVFMCAERYLIDTLQMECVALMVDRLQTTDEEFELDQMPNWIKCRPSKLDIPGIARALALAESVGVTTPDAQSVDNNTMGKLAASAAAPTKQRPAQVRTRNACKPTSACVYTAFDL